MSEKESESRKDQKGVKRMIKMYSTHCPKCKILETKLKQKNIQYEECNDVDEMLKKGIETVPVLEVDGQLLDFGKAVKWVNGK